MATVVIHPYKTTCKVTEPYTIVSRGEDVTFHNVTKSEAIVLFPTDEVFSDPRIPVSSGGQEVRPVRKDAEPGFYPYQVYCDRREVGIREFAEGGSGPGMIIR